jgi:hypothetical protein
VRECEGGTSSFRLEVADGKCAAAAQAGSADFTCADRTWAAIAMGELKASAAVGHGLAEGRDATVLALLDTLGHGPMPFCREYF